MSLSVEVARQRSIMFMMSNNSFKNSPTAAQLMPKWQSLKIYLLQTMYVPSCREEGTNRFWTTGIGFREDRASGPREDIVSGRTGPQRGQGLERAGPQIGQGLERTGLERAGSRGDKISERTVSREDMV